MATGDNAAFIQVAGANGQVFSTASNNDLLIYTSNPAKIIIGTSNTAACMVYDQPNSNVTFPGNVIVNNGLSVVSGPVVLPNASISTSAINGTLTQWKTSAGNNKISIQGCNVGIGNTDPFATLDITGNANVSGYFTACNLGMCRNKVVNADMRVAWATSCNVNFAFYQDHVPCRIIDRWFVQSAGWPNAGFSMSQEVLTASDTPRTSDGLLNSLKVTVLSATPSFGYLIPGTSLDGNMVEELRWGTSSGLPATFSFWIRTSAATGSVMTALVRRDGNASDAYAATFTVTTSGAWQKVAVNVPAPPATGAWNSGRSNSVNLCVACYHSAVNIPVGTWSLPAAYTYSAIGASAIYNVANAWVEFTGVQFERGNVTTTLQIRTAALEHSMGLVLPGEVTGNRFVSTNPWTYNTTTPGWYALGLWDCAASCNMGAKLRLKMVGAVGSNGGFQNGLDAAGETRICLTNMDNTTASTVNVDGMWAHEGGAPPVNTIKVVQSTTLRHSYFVYASVNANTQHALNWDTTHGTIFSPMFTSVADPGANSSSVQTLPLSMAVVGSNVGVRTTTPQYALDVLGDMRVNTNLVASNITCSNVSGLFSTFTSATCSNVTCSNLTTVFATMSNVACSNVVCTNVTSSNVTCSNVTACNLTTVFATMSNVACSNINGRVAAFSNMTVASGGKLGVGIASPAAELDVNGYARFISSVSGDMITLSNNNATQGQKSYINLSTTSGGSGAAVGFKMSSFARSGGPACIIQAVDNGQFTCDIAFWMAGNSATDSSSAPLERMRMTASGYLGIGTSTPTFFLQLNNDSAAKPTTNTWTISSDERLKENIILADLDRCYNIVKSVPLKRYTWKQDVYTDDQINDRSKLGWIAQDVESYFPKAVEQREMLGLPDCRTLNADQLYAAMYGALQKVMEEVERLKDLVASMTR